MQVEFVFEKIYRLNYSYLENKEALITLFDSQHSYSCQTSKKELFLKIGDGFQSLTFSAKSSILEVRQNSEYACLTPKLFYMWCVARFGTNVTKINIPPWVFFTFLKLYKWYQIANASHIGRTLKWKAFYTEYRRLNTTAFAFCRISYHSELTRYLTDSCKTSHSFQVLKNGTMYARLNEVKFMEKI